MAYVYIYNYSGTELNIEATANTCTHSFNGVTQVCTWAANMPSNNHTEFSVQNGAQQTGLQAQSVDPNGPKPLTFQPLETGSIVVNEQTGALEFQPGAPGGGGQRAAKFPAQKKK